MADHRSKQTDDCAMAWRCAVAVSIDSEPCCGIKFNRIPESCRAALAVCSGARSGLANQKLVIRLNKNNTIKQSNTIVINSKGYVLCYDIEDMTKHDLYEDDNGENQRHAQELIPQLKLAMSTLAHRLCSRMEIRLCLALHRWIPSHSSHTYSWMIPDHPGSIACFYA